MTDGIKVNQRDLIDGLRRFQEEFYKDFSHRDVLEYLSIPKCQFQEIIKARTEKEVIDRLFFYYIYQVKNVELFINVLKDSYKWLYDGIHRSKNDKWISDYRRAITDIPDNRDWNIHRTRYLWEIQQNLKTLTRGKYLILFGKVGFGKRWLAVDACRDYAIISRMNFKIYWLNVSKCNTFELILEKMHRLKVLLQDDLEFKNHSYDVSSKNAVVRLREHLRKVLEQPAFKDCLIVLTGVQDEHIIKSFDLNCKMLLTTRHMEKLEKLIPKECREIIEIDQGFTLDESQELFLKGTHLDDINKLPNYMTTFIHEMHEKCSGHPIMISLIAKTFQNMNESDEKRKKRCQNWREHLESHKFEDEFIRILMSINESLQLLENENLIKAYRKMAIFTDNVDLSVDVLSKLWNTSHRETESMIEKFYKYSLLERQRNETEICSLHYVHNKYLKSEVSKDEQREYHQFFLDKYEVETTFLNRNSVELNFQDDRYIHFFIGYHILGAERHNLFALYLDFGFLEEKIRIATLPNILGDLEKFSKEIEKHEGRNKGLRSELLTFLPPVEKLLLKSKDITLLQCALNYEGVIKEAAIEQSKQFQDRVWFNDVNHLENANQTIEIHSSSSPKIVRFAQPEESLLCLICLQDHNIILHEMSNDYNLKPIIFRNDIPTKSIVEMQIFRNVAFLMLNDAGKLWYYNIKIVKSSVRRPSVVAPLSPSRKESFIDKYPLIIDNRNDRITCFYVFEEQSSTNADLIIGTSRGILKIYQWTSACKFEDKKQEIDGKIRNLFRIAVINDYAMMINTNGDIGFVNLINGAKMCSNIPMDQHTDPLNLHQGFCRRNKVPITLLVTAHKVIQIKHKKKEVFLTLEKETVFTASDEFDDLKILSSAMSKDADFIILGTTSGILVIDRYEKKILYRRIISDQVLSLDVHRDLNETSMYFLVSVIKDADKAISFQAFHCSNDSNNFSIPQNEMKFLVGSDLFDIKKNNDVWNLVAVDSKRNIHLASSDDDFIESSLILPFKYQIKKICFINDRTIICGCTNGHVYKMDLHTNRYENVVVMSGEITYMENFHGSVVISTNTAHIIVELRNSISDENRLDEVEAGNVSKAYKFNDNLLLIVLKDCSMYFLEMKRKIMLKKLTFFEEDTCVAEAYCNSMLAIATARNNIFLFEFNGNINDTVKTKSIEGQLSDDISSIAISPEKNILAVGCFNGSIELFDLNLLIPIKTLESHRRTIMSLQFSPWHEDEGHLILLSLSESINFWNITHILNNRDGMKRVETTPSRISARFKSPLKVVKIDSSTERQLSRMNLKEKSWSNKTGPVDKRELLSCIKFIGKSAKKVVVNDDFTRFVTIDNEGNVYHLRMIDQASNDDQQVRINFNGISLSG